MDRRTSTLKPSALPPRTVATSDLRNSSGQRRQTQPIPRRVTRPPISNIAPRPVTDGHGCGWTCGTSRVETARITRYPNYLPAMKARRAELAERDLQNITLPVISDAEATYNRGILRSMVRLADTQDLLMTNASNLVNPGGHPLYVPPETLTRRCPRVVLSLYQAPQERIAEWDIESPLIQVDYLRHGLGVGPTVSQLPSPESSHSVMFSIRGRNNRERFRHNNFQPKPRRE